MSNSLWPNGLYSPWNSPSQNTGVGSLSLLQGIFPTQGSNSGLPHCRWILYQLSHKGRDQDFWQSHPHQCNNDSHVKMNLRQALIPASPGWQLVELQGCFPLACVTLNGPAGSQTFAQAQTVTTEAIKVVMRIWHPKCYFLQDLSFFQSILGVKKKINLLCLFATSNCWPLKISHIRSIPEKETKNRGRGKHLKFPRWKTSWWKCGATEERGQKNVKYNCFLYCWSLYKLFL